MLQILAKIIDLLMFFLSLFMAISTVLVIQKKLKLTNKLSFLSLPSFLLLYITFLSANLSLFKALTNINFLLAQSFIFLTTTLSFKTIIKEFFNNNQLIVTIKKLAKNILNIFLQDKISFILGFIIIIIIETSLISRLTIPVVHFDDLMYRGSTPLHWIQNKSILPFETLNERKNVYLYGSGLIYMWPLIFNVHEKIAQIFYWLSLPLGVVFFQIAFKAISNRRRLRLMITLLFVTSPYIFSFFSKSLIQELWITTTLLSYIYYIFTLLTTKEKLEIKNLSLLIGITSLTLVMIKINTLVYLLLPFLVLKGLKNYWFIAKKIIVTFIFLFLISGYSYTVFNNWQHFGSPLGSNGFRKITVAIFSPKQIATHLIRLPFIFFDPPVFSKKASETLNLSMNTLASYVDANYVLPGEEQKNWISSFKYKNIWPNERCGLAGIATFLIFWAAMGKFIFTKNSHSKLLVNFSALVIAQILYIRWAEGSLLPYRHLLSVIPIFLLFSDFIFPQIKSKKYQKIIPIIIATTLIIVIIPFHLSVITTLKENRVFYDSFKKKTSQIQAKDEKLPQPRLLIFEDQNFTDYFFFFNNGYQKNKVFLFTERWKYNNKDLENKITEIIKNQDINYLVFNDTDVELAKVLSVFGTTEMIHQGPNHTSILKIINQSGKILDDIYLKYNFRIQ